jgi:hypothetical protein
MIKLLAAVAALGTIAGSVHAADLGAVQQGRLEEGGPGIKIGILTCGIESGIGFIVVSHKGLDCVYAPADGGPVEKYSGSITRIGLDIGITHQSTVTWAVIAPGQIRPGALAGGYGGASAEATAVVGWGANVLVGGSFETIALQPLSFQAQTGLDVAAGIAGLQLDSDEAR